MTIERDELASMISGVSPEAQLADADCILAAGYRKLPQVTTIEELDALPEYSVIRDADETIRERLDDPETNSPLWAGRRGYVLSYRVPLPATVLHFGSAE